MAEVLNPSTAEEWKASGNEFYKVKNYSSAISSYSKAIEMEPSNAMYYTNRAAAYLMSLQYKDAVVDCDQAIKIDGACAKAYFRKASALKGIGQLDQAIDALNRGLEYEPNSSTATTDRDALVQSKAKVQAISDLVTDKRFSLALTQIDLLMREIGSSYPVLTVLKLTCLYNLNRPEEAFNLSNTLLRNHSVFSSDSKVLLLRAQCLFSMGDLENSVKHCQQALRGDPDNSGVRSYYKAVKEVVEKKAGGDSDYKEGQFQSAVAQYTVCIDTILGMQGLNSVYVAKILLNRGVCRHKLKKHEDAVRDFNKALYYHKTYAKAVVKRGDCFLAMGGVENIQKAINDYEQAQGMESDPPLNEDLESKVRKAKTLLKRASRKDLYAVMELSSEASETEIKSAYRKLALKYHPDKQASKSEGERAEAEKKFKEIGEAYEILSNPEKRARYDEGVELEDLDNPHAGHGHGHGGMDMDENMMFHMFMQQQQQQQRRGGGGRGGFY